MTVILSILIVLLYNCIVIGQRMKYLLYIFLLLSIVYSETIINYLSSDDIVICLMEIPSEGESDNENQEESKEEQKIEIIASSFLSILDEQFHKNNWYLNYFNSNENMQVNTPPPKRIS